MSSWWEAASDLRRRLDAEERSGFREYILETLSLGISAKSSASRDFIGTAYCKHGSQPLLSLCRWLEAVPRRRQSQNPYAP
jgi:hypothetical protein